MMPQPLDVQRLMATGRQLADTGRSQARQLGTELVAQSRLATEQLSSAVDELVSRAGRERVEELRQMLRAEVQQQLQTLTVAIKNDLAKGRAVTDRIESAISELRAHRNEREHALREAVRDEVQREFSALELATRDDLAALGQSIRDHVTALKGSASQHRSSSTTDDEGHADAAPGPVTPTQPDAMITTPTTP
jgi:polyhydroxyalkanoate synthesis regulator phasin